MKLLNLLTVLFVGLKLLGKIDWSWWLVLSPTIASILFWILAFTIVFWCQYRKTPEQRLVDAYRNKYNL